MNEDRHAMAPLAVVTGATAGLGLETAKGLAAQGYRVIVAARNADKGALACHAIRAHAPGAIVRYEALDLDSLESVRDFARRLRQTDASLERLINNAGVMAVPRLERTREGFERQLGVNYLGHFLLTSELLPLLSAATAPRVVQLSSLAHRSGHIDFDNLNGERHYDPWRAYRQSKLAMLLFAQALQKHSDDQDWGLLSLAAHPGLSRTALFDDGVKSRPFIGSVFKLTLPLISQSAAEGARPTLHAALSDHVGPGEYIGPGGLGETRGAPKTAHRARNARDTTVEARLWDVSCELTGARWEATAPA
ncbi:NAD(P)-dependent dehydrogenase (short-subunit alcohol dehydrogenase family) [Chromohalobacter marismortui]|uniref:NAD(P)-dependent dehydrogenase (Short-subunit alcohol dehydrogenase family) n=1 Tax=Chromohalobacter marismortui TaxID=42055 RepID=A0A4R7NNL7_9GAMM|nr:MULTISPECIES: oxidoreductase [Chromohalobacter]MCI0509502.1 oxidoreductase [Chromohalobacter sp.]MCI0592604.1 oxidoreductase [Chromohalobacter sp.]TDU22222.1 NAD(P)-dependent dehydrogenase (short-subunit alcohol dehydrogenase family) [Chromohalobacter marismortui]